MGKQYKNYGLGRIQSPFDVRDYNLANFIPVGMPLTIAKEVVWDYPSQSLDQGETPHCVGFSMANFGINSPINTMYTNQDGHDFYYMCKVVDGRPGVEEGSYVRSGAKVLKDVGRIDAYAFAPSIEVIKWWLFNRGSVIVGTIWTEEMFLPNSENIIKIGGAVVGGHAYLLNEWREDNYIGIQNSWGEGWGENGKAYISAEDFGKLFTYGGEALAAVELPHVGGEPSEKPGRPCFVIDFFKALFKA